MFKSGCTAFPPYQVIAQHVGQLEGFSYNMQAFAAGLEAADRKDWDAFEKAAWFDLNTAAMLLKDQKDDLPLEVGCRIALQHYSDRGDSMGIIRKYVRRARCIRPENWRDLLPESVRKDDSFLIYRGGSEDISQCKTRLSWTLFRDVAEWFIERNQHYNRGFQHLYCARIAADDVIAYLPDRSEFEILQYRKVKDVAELPIQGVSTEFNNLLDTYRRFVDSEKLSAAKLDLFNKRQTEAKPQENIPAADHSGCLSRANMPSGLLLPQGES